MNKVEFAEVIKHISDAIGKELPVNRMEAYWEYLQDLPIDVFRVAARRVVLSHPWATFPSITELREAAALTIQGDTTELPAAQAWELAWNAVKQMDSEIPCTIEAAKKSLPGTVWKAMNAFGMQSLIYGKDPVSVIRGQFIKIYEQLASRDKRESLIPADLRQMIEGFGKMPEEVRDNRSGREILRTAGLIESSKEKSS